MTLFEATMIAEGNFEMAEPETVAQYEDPSDMQVAAFQKLIDTGMAWQMQGYFGRTAAHLIEIGLCSMRERR